MDLVRTDLAKQSYILIIIVQMPIHTQRTYMNICVKNMMEISLVTYLCCRKTLCFSVSYSCKAIFPLLIILSVAHGDFGRFLKVCGYRDLFRSVYVVIKAKAVGLLLPKVLTQTMLELNTFTMNYFKSELRDKYTS